MDKAKAGLALTNYFVAQGIDCADGDETSPAISYIDGEFEISMPFADEDDANEFDTLCTTRDASEAAWAVAKMAAHVMYGAEVSDEQIMSMLDAYYTSWASV